MLLVMLFGFGCLKGYQSNPLVIESAVIPCGSGIFSCSCSLLAREKWLLESWLWMLASALQGYFGCQGIGTVVMSSIFQTPFVWRNSSSSEHA